ncbi:hypothetical protein LTR62_005659 [Meristemomyces frigidus]|uniref:FMN hydroxy acid dehydrogenase domain-containing protein n=1 Tax=Meristemomyces frigidus TaxID=1508187 RepID=A0AAN7TGN9_9PEZI|nr:hypothetical protein LTR62_005659 [Meristemomyces frigidus]
MAGNPVPIPVKHLDEKVLCIDDLRKAASGKLPGNFFNSGSTDQITINENSTAYNKYRLRPRVLVDVSAVNTTTACFGQTVAFPLGVSPAGLQAMAHPEGELATARACAKRGGMREWVGGDGLTDSKDRELELRIIREAEVQGCSAIFLTADSPVLGVRYNEWRGDFRTPPGLGFPVLERSSEQIRQTSHDDGFLSFNDDAHNWTRDIPWLRSVTKMEVWIKGVLTAEDTLKAIEMGCEGIIVSNHGGRQLDGVPATIDALPECVEAAAGRIHVHIDGGIRSGTDIFKALALGAEHVWVGRPAIWGLAYEGEKGVDLMLETLYNEFKRCMQLTGCNSVKDITKACLGVMRVDGPLARL